MPQAKLPSAARSDRIPVTYSRQIASGTEADGDYSGRPQWFQPRVSRIAAARR